MQKHSLKLNKRFFPVIVAFALFFGICSPVLVNADVPTKPINYMDLDYIVKEGAAYNQVTVPIPVEYLYLGIYNQATGKSEVARSSISSISHTVDPGISYTLRVYPFSTIGLLLENIPEGTRLNFTLRVSVNGTENFYLPSIYKDYQYKDASGNYIGNLVMSQIDGTVYEEVRASYELKSIPDGAYSFIPRLRYVNFGTAYAGSTTYTFIVDDVSLVMDISNGYWEEWLANQTGKMIADSTDQITDAIGESTSSITNSLGDVEQSVIDSGNQVAGAIEDSTNKIMEGSEYLDDISAESNYEMSAAAGKLDDLGNQLNSLDKPNINTFQIGLGDMVGDSFSVPMLTAPIREIWNSPVALGILTIVVTLVLVSWVFFGKK